MFTFEWVFLHVENVFGVLKIDKCLEGIHKMHTQSPLIRSITFLMKKDSRVILILCFFKGIFDPIINVIKVFYSSALPCSSRFNH